MSEQSASSPDDPGLLHGGIGDLAGEDLFQALLDSAPDAVIIVDADGRIRLVNRQAEAVFGYAREELLGHLVDQLVPAGALRRQHPQHRAAYLADARPRPMGAGLDLRAVRKDGTEFPVDIALSALTRQADGRMLVMASVRDVTERRRLEEELRSSKRQAEEANRAKSEFLSRMSHELRTPLNAVLGFAQLLELDPLSIDQKESVAHIRRAGSHLLELINEVLDIARIESGQMVLSNEPVALRGIVEECVALIRPLAAARAVTLAHPDPGSCDVVVAADQQRIKQVLINLLSNAVKYNRQGGRVDLGWFTRNGEAYVQVRDTGPGIASSNLGRLFTPFDRLGAEQVDVEGSGVGLTISLKLIEAMNGRLEVDTAVGQGSTFTAVLPLAEDAATTSDDRTEIDLSSSGRQAVLLYVEDNLSNLRLMERVVALRPRWRLVHALTAASGIEQAVLLRPELVLLDLHLPDLPGTEVLARLRADRRTHRTPVIMVSADATKERRRQLLDAGADGYLTKPIDVSQVLALLDRVAASVSDGLVAEGEHGDRAVGEESRT